MYHNPVFKMKNNGWISKTINMTRGIRQGCPISAILYLFVAEILSLKIKQNDQIQGFHLENMDLEIKNIQHADDLTLTLKNELSLENAVSTVKEFCDHAGSKINLNKLNSYKKWHYFDC